MRKQVSLWYLCFLLILLLMGCGKENAAEILVNVTTPLEVDAEALNNVSVTLPEGMSREPVSEIQHDFIQGERQVGGIVIVDISNEMLDMPYASLIQISDLLGQQLMPSEDPNNIMFLGAGGNDYAYMEVYTGGDQIRFFHYLFRGKTNNYDVWFDYELMDEETIAEIISTVSADDITSELNKSIM